MSCQRCKSDRIVYAGAKCSDTFHASVGEREHDGFVPSDMNIGGGDYMEIEYCADCGQIQDEFPLQPMKMEVDEESDESLEE